MAIETSNPDEVDVEALLGSAIERREDPHLLTGDTEYTDNIRYPGTAHLAILRSQYAHARIEDIDASAAEAMDGVAAVYTFDDVEASGAPGLLPALDPPHATVPDRPILARDRVRYQGEPIAAVVAEDRYTAHDALDRIDVDYDRLDAAVDPTEAVDGDAPVLHDEAPDNVGIEWETGDADATDAAFDDAAHVVELDLVNQRLVPTAMEPRAAIARYRESTGELSIELTSQNPHHHQHDLSATLGIPDHKIRVRAPDVGGGFGSKIHRYPAEAITAWCATQLGRPIKWQATRTEGFSSTSHGRDHVTTAALALDADGGIQGLRVRTHVGLGGYMSTVQASVAAPDYGRMLCGQYDVPAAHVEVVGAYTATTPVDAYRGAGRPEACYVIERLLTAAAQELDVDPVELRRRNFLSADEFPHEVPTGHVYDSGDYEKPLETALDTVDYESFRERQADAREEGRYLGIGLSCYIEACGVGPGLFESGQVQLKSSGLVVVKAGTHSHGQGHGTSFAQIVASELGVPYDDVEVSEGDTAEIAEGSGTYGSRSAPVGGSAILNSAQKVVEKARRIAAHQLEASPEDVEFADGEFSVAGAPDRAISIQAVAAKAYVQGNLPDDEEPGLESTSFYDPENFTFPFGTHVAIVEVDPESGEIEIERYVAVDDVGNQINPKIVEGQIHGGVAQGLGQALYEGAVYDENGNLLTGSLQDYAMPKAEHIPELENYSTITPCPHNPLGVKGVGEAGTIAAPPAMVNAVVDALSPFGVTHLDMPLRPETVWRAIRDVDGA